jgi:hypothetical protein
LADFSFILDGAYEVNEVKMKISNDKKEFLKKQDDINVLKKQKLIEKKLEMNEKQINEKNEKNENKKISKNLNNENLNSNQFEDLSSLFCGPSNDPCMPRNNESICRNTYDILKVIIYTYICI